MRFGRSAYDFYCEDVLAKAARNAARAAHKYIRRERKGTKWVYWYKDAQGREYSSENKPAGKKPQEQSAAHATPKKPSRTVTPSQGQAVSSTSQTSNQRKRVAEKKIHVILLGKQSGKEQEIVVDERQTKNGIVYVFLPTQQLQNVGAQLGEKDDVATPKKVSGFSKWHPFKHKGVLCYKVPQ